MNLLINLLDVLDGSKLDADYWQAQNIAFYMKQNGYQDLKKKGEDGEQEASEWCQQFERLYHNLNLKI
jgi:uncharacterized protein YhaN